MIESFPHNLRRRMQDAFLLHGLLCRLSPCCWLLIYQFLRFISQQFSSSSSISNCFCLWDIIIVCNFSCIWCWITDNNQLMLCIKIIWFYNFLRVIETWFSMAITTNYGALQTYFFAIRGCAAEDCI